MAALPLPVCVGDGAETLPQPASASPPATPAATSRRLCECSVNGLLPREQGEVVRTDEACRPEREPEARVRGPAASRTEPARGPSCRREQSGRGRRVRGADRYASSPWRPERDATSRPGRAATWGSERESGAALRRPEPARAADTRRRPSRAARGAWSQSPGAWSGSAPCPWRAYARSPRARGRLHRTEPTLPLPRRRPSRRHPMLSSSSYRSLVLSLVDVGPCCAGLRQRRSQLGHGCDLAVTQGWHRVPDPAARLVNEDASAHSRRP